MLFNLKLKSIFLIIIFSSLFTAVSYTHASESIINENERNWLLSHKEELIFAPDPSYAPFEFFDAGSASTKGLAHEYIDAIEKKLDIKFKILKAGSFNEVLKLAKEKKTAIVNAVTMTPERSEYLLFTDPILEIKNVILVRKNISGELTLNELKDKKISVVKGYAITEFLLKNYPSYSYDIVSTDLNALLNAAYGLSDAAIVDLATSSYMCEKEGITNLRIAGDAGYPIKLAIGSRRDLPELNLILDKALKNISESERNAIYHRWINIEETNVFKSKTFWNIILALLIFFVLVLYFILLWNRQLKKQVEIRTADLRMTHEALSKSEARFRVLVEQAPEAIVVFEAGLNRFVDCNDNALKLFGCGREELFKSDHRSFYPRVNPCDEETFTGMREYIARALAGENIVLEREVLSSDGKASQCEVRMTRLPSSGGELVRMSFIDITERKRSEEAVKLARDQACAANKAKSIFLANMSHELRTPMNGIIGFSELLSFSELNSGQKEFVEMIKMSSFHLLELIDDLLDFSKLEVKKMSLDKKPFDIRALVMNSRSLVCKQIENKKLEIECGVDPEIKYWLMGDQLRFKQILLNLLTNAIKFTPSGAIKVNVSQISKNEADARIALSVIDEGIGMPSDKTGEIFEMFHQLDDSSTRRHGGAGLGLSIVKNLVELMNGTISVKSEVGKGSCFTVEMPFETCSGPLNSSAETTGFPAPLRSGKPLRIILAEDDETGCKLIRIIAKGFGWNLVIAGNGMEALEFYKAGNFDAILMDGQMPEMNGFEAVSEIRKLEAHSGGHIPIIALTAYAMDGDKEKFIAAGMDGYITKPITNIDDFYKTVMNSVKIPDTSEHLK